MPYSPTTWVDEMTPVDATNMNNLEDGVSKAPYGSDGTSGQVAVADGSGGWTYKKVTASEIDAAAAILASQLAGGITNAKIDAAAAIAYSKLNLAAAIQDSDIKSGENLEKLSAVTGTPDGTKFLRDDGSWAVAASSGSASDHAPVLHAVTTNPTLGTGSVSEGQYATGGKIVQFSGRIKFGTSGVSAGSGLYQIVLPVTSAFPSGATLEEVVGFAWLYDSSTGTIYVCAAELVSGGVLQFRTMISGGNVVADSVPFTWAASDQISFGAAYRAA